VTGFDQLTEWISSRESLLWVAGSLSMAMFAFSAILLPVIIVRLPVDYLKKGARPYRPRFLGKPIDNRVYWVLKNLLGGLLLIAGIVMLVIPGQGILTIIVGIGLMDFPFKHDLLARFVGRRRVLRALNRLRARFGRPPLRPPG
jgi:hypothetical protein